MIKNPGFTSIIINGGEPTIHPRFLDICAYLKEQFKHNFYLTLGTNLIPWGWSRGRYTGIQEVILKTFDHIDVGCDDEHRNIDLLEHFAPIIIKAGLTLDVNVMKDYCSEETKQRILAVKNQYGINISFSGVHHYYNSKPIINNISKPCQKRAQDLLINCSGDAFFCYLQEMENPIFNLFTTNEKELTYYLNEYKPEPYRFCACCPYYNPESFFPIQKIKKFYKFLYIETKKALKLSLKA